jgi:hypothetical protein
MAAVGADILIANEHDVWAETIRAVQANTDGGNVDL